jgi:AcrR family transcriptional regulator
VTHDRRGDGAPEGLRARKKQATREALSLAAARLPSERGLENVRVEDIAAAAGVSPRTFSNYFANKYDALVSRTVDRAHRAAEMLRALPPDVPLWEAITRATMAPYGGAARAERAPDPGFLAGLRRLHGSPTMLGESLKAGIAADSALAAAIAARTGTDLYPRLVTAAVTTAVHIATDHWMRADPPVPLGPLIAEVLRQLAAGLPDPAARGRTDKEPS